MSRRQRGRGSVREGELRRDHRIGSIGGGCRGVCVFVRAAWKPDPSSALATGQQHKPPIWFLSDVVHGREGLVVSSETNPYPSGVRPTLIR